MLLYDISEDYTFVVTPVLNFSQQVSIFNLILNQRADDSLTSIFYDNVSFNKNTTATVTINITSTDYTMHIYENGNEIGAREPNSTVTNFEPEATINSPANGSVWLAGEDIQFSGSGWDQEDGELSYSSHLWTSDLDGSIGIGKEFNAVNLPSGKHKITLRVNDSSDDLMDTDSIEISVAAPISIGVTGTPQNGTVTKQIMVNNITGLGYGAAVLKYNSSVVQVTNVTSGNENALNVSVSGIYNADNMTLIYATNSSGMSGDVILANVTFEAVGEEGNSSPILLEFVSLKDTWGDDIPYIVINGSFTVVDATTPPASITNLINTTYEQTYINWTWTNPEDADFNHVTIYLDGVWQINTSETYYNTTDLLSGTTHEIGTHTVDTSGNINSTWVNHTSTTASIPANTAPVANANGPYTGNESTPITLDGSGSYDPDDDELHYRWDFRNDGTWDTDWSSSPTADYTWDDDWTGTAKLEVSDGELNDTDTAIVTVNNVPPTIDSLTGSLDPIEIGNPISLTATFTDPGLNDSHNTTFDWDDNTTTDYALINGEREITGTHTYTEAGVYKVTLTIEDDDGGVDSEVFRYIVIYDPEGGFVTGGGWIISPEGAYAPDPTLTGKANFGFVSKYKKGQQTPTGNTEFQFKAGDLNFHSSDYDWLVIAGHKAMYKGTGTINGAGNYGFMISAIDEDLTPSTDVDLFRIKIWDKDNGDAIVYDNLMGADDDADPTTEIGGGQIKIHKQN